MVLSKLSKSNLHDLLKQYGLDEKDVYIDDNGDPWFTQNFLVELFEVSQPTISENIKKLVKLGEIDSKNNIKKFILIHSKKPVEHYHIEVLYRLGMWLRSPRALEFRKNIIKLLEGLRKGELKITTTQKLDALLLNLPDTDYRLKKDEEMIEKGIPESYVSLRHLTVKQTSLLKELSREFNINFPKTMEMFSKIIYSDGTDNFDSEHNITNPGTRRDYLSPSSWSSIQLAENTLLQLLLEHEGDLSKVQREKYLQICENVLKGTDKLLKDNNLIQVECTDQSNLDEYWTV